MPHPKETGMESRMKKEESGRQTRLDHLTLVVSVVFSVWLLVLFVLFFLFQEYSDLIAVFAYICGATDALALGIHYYMKRRYRCYVFFILAAFFLWLFIIVPKVW